MIRLTVLLVVAVLAGCGADGEPETPTTTENGITVSGNARFGVKGTF